MEEASGKALRISDVSFAMVSGLRMRWYDRPLLSETVSMGGGMVMDQYEPE